MSKYKIPSEFEEIWKQAENLVKSDPSAQQAVAVLTSQGNIFGFINHHILSGNTGEEEAFVRVLAEKKDTEIRYAVCLWNSLSPDISSLDIPSYHLRELLAGLNPANRKTEFLLNGGDGFHVKAIEKA